MDEPTLRFLLILGFLSIPAYLLVDLVAGWILNGATRTCESCQGTGNVRDTAGLYWRCNTCEGRGERLVAA
jgi:hypothetical protein